MNAAIATRTRAVRPDQPQNQGLCIVPILGPSHDRPEYRLLEGDALNLVRVTEVNQSGSVPELTVVNELDACVFLMDCQELLGAKQNRILNTDVLVGAKASITIPVSCVEAHRWSYSSPSFSVGKSASYSIRAGKHARVHDSLKRGESHDADQGAVWNEVSTSLHAAGAVSPSAALHDAYEQRKQDLTRLRSSLRMPEEAVGLAVFRGERFQGLDLFDRHTTLKYFWESLLDSYAIDFLAEAVDPKQPPASPLAEQVQRLLETAAGGQWESFKSPGLGMDWRLEDPTTTGSALVAQDVVIHLQLFPKREQAQRRPRIHRRYVA
jgi:hypothetical protein